MNDTFRKTTISQKLCMPLVYSNIWLLLIILIICQWRDKDINKIKLVIMRFVISFVILYLLW